MVTLPSFFAAVARISLELAAVPALPTGAALQEAVSARSSEFFRIFFDECDPERLATFYAPDFEFYHDRGGRSVGGDVEVRTYKARCAARLRPGATLLRRELLRGSQRIFPIPGFGAIEEGEHLFYTRRPDQRERLTSRGRYLQVWQLSPAGWRLTRVMSFAHERVGVPSATQ
jgi:hypothetical protein